MVTRARPRARCSLRCPYYWTYKKIMLTSSSHRSPLGDHFSSQGSMATFLFQAVLGRSTRACRRVTMVTRARPRARCSLWCP